MVVAEARGLALSDEEFLRDLDGKLHYTTEGRYCGRAVFSDCYHHDRSMTPDSVSRMLRLMNEGDWALRPINTAWGFRAGFDVVKITNELPGMPLQAESVLRFVDDQLPKGTKWGRMARVYMGERNRELLRLAELEEPKKERGHYDY